MTLLAHSLAAIQAGLILGVSLLAAPTAFAALPAASAGPYLRHLFPRYFAAAGGLALATAVIAATGGEVLAALLLAGDAGCFAIALALVPRINAARDRGDPAFRRLHGASVAANAAGLVLALLALVYLAAG
jgi:hypothetical protein